MFALFFRCAACTFGIQLKTDIHTFPLCSNCAASLIHCPSLCIHCNSPVCPTEFGGQCTRPWILPSSIHSYSGRYLLLSTGYTVLRKWKIRRGILFDRQILRTTPELTSQWKAFSAQCIIPVPQHFHRAWKMGGSRAELIAQWVGSELKIPVLQALQLGHTHEPKKRQAELNLIQRLQNRIRFSVDQQALGKIKRVILVDDFMTTGHTLKQASQALMNTGVEKVHAFCLGIRVLRLHTESSSHLHHG